MCINGSLVVGIVIFIVFIGNVVDMVENVKMCIGELL